MMTTEDCIQLPMKQKNCLYAKRLVMMVPYLLGIIEEHERRLDEWQGLCDSYVSQLVKLQGINAEPADQSRA